MKNPWIPTLITIGLGALGTLAPQVQGVVSMHPGWAIGLGAAYAILKGLLPSPIVSQADQLTQKQQ